MAPVSRHFFDGRRVSHDATYVSRPVDGGYQIVIRQWVRDPEEGWDEHERVYDDTVFATQAACGREIAALKAPAQRESAA